jgi:glycine cleavage system regulatory protein
VITVIGESSANAVATIAQHLFDEELDLVSASTAVLGDHFTGVFVVAGSDGAAKRAVQAIEGDAPGVSKAELFPSAMPYAHVRQASHVYDLRFDTSHRIGALMAPLALLGEDQCNVNSLYAHVEDRVSPPIGAIRLTVAADPALTKTKLKERVERLAVEEGWLSFRLSETGTPDLAR